MKLELYKEAVKRTCKDLGQVENISHMALGLASELGELYECVYGDESENVNAVNLGEELGDMMWYITNWANFRKIDLKNVMIEGYVKGRIVAPGFQVVTLIGRLCDAAKRWLAYEQPIEKQKIAAAETVMVIEFINTIQQVALDFSLDIETIMTKNIKKLYVRYPDNFTNDNALVRDLEAEFNVLAQVETPVQNG